MGEMSSPMAYSIGQADAHLPRAAGRRHLRASGSQDAHRETKMEEHAKRGGRGPSPSALGQSGPCYGPRIKPESGSYTLDVLKNQLRPRDAVETTRGGDEYAVSDTAAPNPPCCVPNPDVFSECGLSELPSSIHSDDETEHDVCFVQTCVEEVENAKYAAPKESLLSMRGEDPLDKDLDPRSRLREEVASKRRFVAKKLCGARPTRRSWPLKQGSMRDISQLREDLEQKITTWQPEVDLKLMKSVWCAHARTPEEDEVSEECV